MFEKQLLTNYFIADNIITSCIFLMILLYSHIYKTLYYIRNYEKMKSYHYNNESAGYSIKLLFAGIIIGIVISLLFSIGLKFKKNNVPVPPPQSASHAVPEITIDYINRKLENISSLSTAEMMYNGLYTVSEGKIPFITKKGFSMLYMATVHAGIDASLIEIEITEDKVIVTLPAAEIQMSRVDPDSIQFYDEKQALFNWTQKTDVTEALSAAETDVKEKADTDGLIERANQQAEYIIKGLLEGSVGDRKIIVMHGTSQQN